MLHILLCLYTHVLIASFKCFIYFRRILQIFHLNVSKVDRGVARRGRCPADSDLPQLSVAAAAGAQQWVHSTWVSLCRHRVGTGPATDAGVGAGQDAGRERGFCVRTRHPIGALGLLLF